jgi:hypothetical protein
MHRIRLQPREQRQHHPAERRLDLGQRKQQQAIGAIVVAELLGPVEAPDHQVVGVAGEVICQIEAGHTKR